MFRLIAREIHDHGVYLGTCCVLGAMIISVLICMIIYGVRGEGISATWMIAGLLFLSFGVLGTAQMYIDRANRISTLLSTQAATRNRILLARALTGVMTVLIALIPMLSAGVILLRLKLPPLDFYSRMVWDISAMLILTGLACHAGGLLIGWTRSRVKLIAGFLCLTLLLASLVVIKGFGPSAMVLLALLIMAVWGKVWHTFTSASL